jgi:hypothetical protein
MAGKGQKLARSARKTVSKGQRKRWKKGHSSSSNPENKTHRLLAKNRFFNVDLGE